MVHSFEEPLVMQRQELVMRALTEALRVQVQVDLPQPREMLQLTVTSEFLNQGWMALLLLHQAATDTRELGSLAAATRWRVGEHQTALRVRQGVQLALAVGASRVNLIEGEQGNIGEPDGNRERGRPAERPPRRQ